MQSVSLQLTACVVRDQGSKWYRWSSDALVGLEAEPQMRYCLMWTRYRLIELGWREGVQGTVHRHALHTSSPGKGAETNEMTQAGLRDWIERWDRQQEFYLPYREERYDAMTTVLRHLVASGKLGPGLRILDLGCGTGAIGQRLLTHFPEATYVGLDVDVALLELARSLRPAFGERFTVVERDLALDTWTTGFAGDEFDVVASSTALHWLDNQGIARVFSQMAPLMRANSVFFNADNLAFSSGYWQDVADAVDHEQQQDAAARGREDWDAWWSAVRVDPHLAAFAAERDRRFPPRDTDTTEASPPLLSDYVAALEHAGFVDIDVLWQKLDDRLLAARRPA